MKGAAQRDSFTMFEAAEMRGIYTPSERTCYA